jgi:hypothetical protein
MPSAVAIVTEEALERVSRATADFCQSPSTRTRDELESQLDNLRAALRRRVEEEEARVLSRRPGPSHAEERTGRR